MPDLPQTFGHYPTMTDGLGANRHCIAHPKFDPACDRCLVADRLNHGSWLRRKARDPKPRKLIYPHDVPGTMCKCSDCFVKMRQIAEGKR